MAGDDPATGSLLARLSGVVAKELRPGDQLPSELELARRFEVSRSTIREALKGLERDGLVYSVRGRGRFVSPMGSLSVDRPITRYESSTMMMGALGYDVTTIVLEVGEAEASARAAELLELSPGDPVIRLTRLHVAGDVPLVLSENILPRDRLPGPIRHRDWSASLTGALAAHGHQPVSSLARIAAAALPEPTASRYSLAGWDPWLLIEETSLTVSGERVLYSLDYHRGDLIGFNVLRNS